MSMGESDELNIPDGMPVNPALRPLLSLNFICTLSVFSNRRSCDLFGEVIWYSVRPPSTGCSGGPSEYDASHVEKLREVIISLRRPPLSVLYVAGLSNVRKHAGRAFILKDSEGMVITMAEFLRLPNFKWCKITADALLPPGAARVTYMAPPANRLEDIPSKSSEMLVAEIPCRKVLDDKERKKRKAEEKTVAHAPEQRWLFLRVLVGKATVKRRGFAFSQKWWLFQTKYLLLTL
uniref:Uncharacterized protein n=1 Tax=Tanacetum cinerariifolium TaxID=118510 RepID=A0A6L2NBJ4_TANCI|nr:hypothetical protein [Tanacetum cinerariifolium]